MEGKKLAWSPDGGMLASASADHTIVIWDPRRGRPVQTLAGHASPVLGLAWSPDGKSLASGDDRVVLVWDVATGRRRLHLGPAGHLDAFAWAPNSRALVTTHSAAFGAPTNRPHGCALLWDATSGRRRAIIERTRYSILSLAWSLSGRLLALGGQGTGEQRPLAIWDARSGRLRKPLYDVTSWVIYLAWSRDGRALGGVCGDREVKIWDPRTGRPRSIVVSRDHEFTEVSWSPDLRVFAAAGMGDRALKFWDTATGKLRASYRAFSTPVRDMAWRPDGKLLAASDDYATILWESAGSAPPKRIPLCVGPFAWSPDGRILAAGPNIEHKTALLLDGRTGHRVGALVSHAAPVLGVSLSPQGRIASVLTGSRALLLDMATGAPSGSLQTTGGALTSVTWSPDGRTLAGTLVNSVYAAGHVSRLPASTGLLWDAATGRPARTLVGAVAPTAWSPDGKALASGSPHLTATIWDAASGKPRFVLPAGTSVTDLAWSPTGGSLASAGASVKLWDASIGSLLVAINSPAERLAWSSQGGIVAGAKGCQAVLLWDGVTGRMCQTLSQRPAEETGPYGHPTLAWNPNGTLLATGCTLDRLVRVWNVRDGRLSSLLTLTQAGVNALSWGPNGNSLAAGTSDNRVIVWMFGAGSPRVVALRGHSGAVTDVQWCRDGHRLITGSEDGSVRVWRVADGRELVAFYPIDGGTEWLTLTPDGYFEASRQGAKFIRWRQGSRLWPVTKFRRRFERPDLVRKALAG